MQTNKINRIQINNIIVEKLLKMKKSKIYTFDGELLESDLLYNNNPIFRKMTQNKAELEIAKILMKHPHDHIVIIYNVGSIYIDMELLDVDHPLLYKGNPTIKEKMLLAKDHLQQLGIMYIDWKIDNIGLNKNGNSKLFDFDGSGMIDIKNNLWKIKPPPFWSYNKALENGIIDPIEIDNFAYNYNLCTNKLGTNKN